MGRTRAFFQLLIITHIVSRLLSIANAHEHEPTEIPGSLANLSIHQKSIQLELYIGIEGFELVTGHELPREHTDEYYQNWDFHSYHHHHHHDRDENCHENHDHHDHCCYHHYTIRKRYDFTELLNKIITKSKENISQIEKFLNQHIHISTEDTELNGKVSRIEKSDPKYIVIQLDYPYEDATSIESLEILYQYEPVYEGTDQLCLAVYDKRLEESQVQVIHLHSHRKTAHWSADSLTSTFYPFKSTAHLSGSVLSVFILLIAAHLFNLFISRRNKGYVNN